MEKSKFSPEIVLATAGLGNSDFLAAGRRVIRQAQGFGYFSDFRLLTSENLPFLCPTVSQKYADFLNPSTRGFGFMSWKAELAYRSLTQTNGEVLYLWVDAGCEMFPTPIGKSKLRKYLNQLERDGYLYFTLDTPESEYTKVGLFDSFPSLSKHDTSPQAQTTVFGLYGKIGQTIAQRWFDVVTSDIKTVNEEDNYSFNGSAVHHRHDQSVFSLVLKELGLKSNLKPLKSDKSSMQIVNRLKYMTQPILACRNRTGLSVIES
jgi:hypothetical protein